MSDPSQQNQRRPDEQTLERVEREAIQKYKGTIELLAAGAAQKPIATLSRVGRVAGINTVTDKAQFDDVKPGIESFVGTVARDAYTSGLEAAVQLQPERIKTVTDFTLAMTFPELAKEGFVSPSVHDERERLSEEYGEYNVLTSFFTDEAGVVQLGLFVRRPGE